MLTPKPNLPPAYVPGLSKPGSIKLSSNENALGCSPLALEAFRNFRSLHRYPDGSAGELRRAIADVHGLEVERIVCGAGSDELITLLARAYAGQGDEIIHTRHGFAMYNIAAQSVCATPVIVDEKDYTADVDAILNAVTPNTRIVFFANPNNPTGTYIPKQEVMRLRQGLREDILLVIDSAYAECADAPDYADGREVVAATDNTVMLRTFSKIYGLAGLRLGWAYAHPSIIDVLDRIRNPFNVSSVAIAVGIVAVRDQVFVEKSVEYNARQRTKLFDELTRLDLQPLPSQANFVTAKFGDDKEAGKSGFEFLESKGILVRPISVYAMPEYLRLSIGAGPEIEKLSRALGEFKNPARTIR